MSTTIYINGVDKTADILYKTVSFNKETNNKTGSMEFSMIAVANLPVEGDVVEVWEGTDLMFSGLIFNSKAMSPVPQKDVIVHVMDWYDMTMQRYVRDSYVNQTLEQIINDIIWTRIHSDDLKLMLRFEDGAGTTVRDYTQFENDGVINGAGYTWDTVNFALSLDGSAGTYLSVPDDGSLDFSTVMSIAVEFTMDNLNETILAKDASGGGQSPYKIYVGADGAVTFSVYDGTNGYSINTASGLITVGVKHSIVCTFDSSSGTGKIYVDGVIQKTGVLTTNNLANSTGSLIIGAVSAGATGALFDALSMQFVTLKAGSGTPEPNFDGKIYRVGAYSKVLNTQECRRWHIDTLEVKAPRRLMEQYDIILDRVTFPFMYPAECLDQLGKMLGLEWRIDENAFINVLDRSGGAPVQTFTEDDGTTLKNKTQVSKFLQDIRNAIYIRGGKYFAEWRSDPIEANGTARTFGLPYKYNSFEMFSDLATLHGDILSKYKMNEASGNLVDVMGANTLTASNLTYSQTGTVGDAIDFNGTNSSARKTSATHDTGDVAHSMTAIINADTHDTTERIICGFGNFAAGHSKLSLIVVTGVYYLRHSFGDGITNSYAVGNLSGGWHMVSMSYDPNGALGRTLKIYVDGVLFDTTNVSAPDIDAGVVEIGGNNGSNVFDGDIDEVTFFKYALSDQEQEAVYNLAFDSNISALLLRSGIEFLNEATDYDGLYNYAEKNYKFINAPTSGTLFYVTGRPELPVQALRSSTGSITTYGRRELQIIDTTIESLVVARQRAAAELAKRKSPLEKINFETYTAGVRPADTITLILPSFGIPSGNYFVQKVQTVAYLPVTAGDGKKWRYKIEAVNVVARDWVDFLRNAFRRDPQAIDPAEGEGVDDLTDWNEAFSVDDSHTIKTATDHAEDLEVEDAHVVNEVTSGEWKWSDDAGTTTDKLRWGLGDWG